jgi:alkanesulfonate monooxygenase SsuD/methylene tetrahydromethanopterin reductase-like flavin-dependent oxidoreductase (luciferase family)
MEFGYFTLSDNHYPDNPRSANEFVLQIREQAILADKLGMHSAWIGEHHFDRLGVNSRPDMLLASIVPETSRIRFAPAVTVLPLHHPLHVAEAWATLDLISNGRVDFACGRGYDGDEYGPFGAPFMQSAEIFDEGVDVLLKAWNEPGSWSHKGTYYDIQNMSITPKPVQRQIPVYIACFSETSLAMAARKNLNIIYAPFASNMIFGGLDKAVDRYREACVCEGNTPGRAMCSYFIHISDTPQEEEYGRRALIDYFQNCVLRAIPSDPSKAPPTMQYFIQMHENLSKVRKEDLTDKSILMGSSSQIIDTLKRVEADGIEEVILYFNVGRKPNEMVKDQMAKFMSEVAPAFESKHKRTA